MAMGSSSDWTIVRLWLKIPPTLPAKRSKAWESSMSIGSAESLAEVKTKGLTRELVSRYCIGLLGNITPKEHSKFETDRAKAISEPRPPDGASARAIRRATTIGRWAACNSHSASALSSVHRLAC